MHCPGFWTPDIYFKNRARRKPCLFPRFGMEILRQFLIILGFSFLGEVLHQCIPLPVPASVYGLVLLFLALQTGVVKLKQVKRVGDFLLKLMPLLFIAPAVNLLDCWDLIAPCLLPVAVIVLVSTMAVFVLSGRLTQWIVGRKEKRRD